jgi:hypothetical protein
MSTSKRSASVFGTVIALLLAFAPNAHAYKNSEVGCGKFSKDSDDEHKDWKTLERTLEDQRQRGNITSEQRDTLMEAYKPGFREYRDQLREECDRLRDNKVPR